MRFIIYQCNFVPCPSHIATKVTKARLWPAQWARTGCGGRIVQNFGIEKGNLHEKLRHLVNKLKSPKCFDDGQGKRAIRNVRVYSGFSRPRCLFRIVLSSSLAGKPGQNEQVRKTASTEDCKESCKKQTAVALDATSPWSENANHRAIPEPCGTAS